MIDTVDDLNEGYVAAMRRWAANLAHVEPFVLRERADYGLENYFICGLRDPDLDLSQMRVVLLKSRLDQAGVEPPKVRFNLSYNFADMRIMDVDA